MKLRFNFEHFQKKRWQSLVMNFWTYGLQKTWLDKCLKSPVWEDPFTSNMVNSLKLLKSERLHLYHIYWSRWTKLRRKKSLWVICNILGLFINALAAEGQYSLLIRSTLLQHFEMQLSMKRKIFPQFLFAFSKFGFSFEHCQERLALLSDVFLSFWTPKDLLR